MLNVSARAGARVAPGFGGAPEKRRTPCARDPLKRRERGSVVFYCMVLDDAGAEFDIRLLSVSHERLTQ